MDSNFTFTDILTAFSADTGHSRSAFTNRRLAAMAGDDRSRCFTAGHLQCRRCNTCLCNGQVVRSDKRARTLCAPCRDFVEVYLNRCYSDAPTPWEAGPVSST